MPTLLDLPVASSPGATDKLWLTQGTGTDRDKQVTAGDLISGALPTVMPSIVAAFPAPALLLGTETVPLLQTTMKEMPIADVVKVYDLNPTLVILQNYDDGADATLSAMQNGSPASIFRVAVSPGGRVAMIDMRLRLLGRPASASNGDPATINIAAAISALSMDAAIISDLETRRVVVSYIHNGVNTLALWSLTADELVSGLVWSTIAPTNNATLELSAQIMALSV